MLLQKASNGGNSTIYLFCSYFIFENSARKLENGENGSKFSQLHHHQLDRLKFVNNMKGSCVEHLQGWQEQYNVRTHVCMYCSLAAFFSVVTLKNCFKKKEFREGDKVRSF